MYATDCSFLHFAYDMKLLCIDYVDLQNLPKSSKTYSYLNLSKYNISNTFIRNRLSLINTCYLQGFEILRSDDNVIDLS